MVTMKSGNSGPLPRKQDNQPPFLAENTGLKNCYYDRDLLETLKLTYSISTVYRNNDQHQQRRNLPNEQCSTHLSMHKWI